MCRVKSARLPSFFVVVVNIFLISLYVKYLVVYNHAPAPPCRNAQFGTAHVNIRDHRNYKIFWYQAAHQALRSIWDDRQGTSYLKHFTINVTFWFILSDWVCGLFVNVCCYGLLLKCLLLHESSSRTSTESTSTRDESLESERQSLLIYDKLVSVIT